VAEEPDEDFVSLRALLDDEDEYEADKPIVTPFDGDRSRDGWDGPSYSTDYQNVDAEEPQYRSFRIYSGDRPPVTHFRWGEQSYRIARRQKTKQRDGTYRSELVALDREQEERRNRRAQHRLGMITILCETPGCDDPMERQTPRDCCTYCYQWQLDHNGEWPSEERIRKRDARRE